MLFSLIDWRVGGWDSALAREKRHAAPKLDCRLTARTALGRLLQTGLPHSRSNFGARMRPNRF
jgi:hypothetical protein